MNREGGEGRGGERREGEEKGGEGRVQVNMNFNWAASKLYYDPL